MVGRTNTGGGGSGATLTIIGVAGATVTASKNGKTYTRTINNSGTAVFKGLSTGTWMVTMSSDGQTATRTVEITADYSLKIAYFSATITITYPANSTCVVTDSIGATIASNTNTGTDTKTWTATVSATGTYTVTATATDGTKTKSESVEITTEGQSEKIVLCYQLVLFDSTTSPSSTFSGSFASKAIPLSASFGDYSGAPSKSYSNDSYVELSQERFCNGFWYYSKDGGLIDLSNYSTINCTIIGLSGDGNKYLAVRDSLNGYGNTNNIATKDIVTGTISVPIETIKSAYIGIMLYNEVTVRLTKLWLE